MAGKNPRNKYPGVDASGRFARIRVRYVDGSWRHETCEHETTPRGLKAAAKLRERVNTLSRAGAIDWAEYFPNSSLVEPPSTIPTFQEVSEGYLRRKRRRLKPSSMKGYEKIVKFWQRIYGDMLITEIRRSDILDAIDVIDWKNGKTMGNFLTPLRGIFQEAILDDLIFKTPVMAIDLPKSQKPLPDPLTVSEMRLVLKEIESSPWGPYFQLAFSTGLRTSELSGLRWESVNFKQKTLSVTNARTDGQDTESTKTARPRTIELNPAALRALKLQRVASLGHDHVFKNPNTGKAIRSDQDARRVWTAVLAKLNIRHRRCYETRHTHATIRLAAGDDLLSVSQDLGHLKPSMTQDHYQGFVKNEDAELAQIAFA